jgi:AcrB/AcrD/AcrF family
MASPEAETLAAQVGVPAVDSSRGLKLVWATGAGAELRQTLGTAVFAGMISVTLFGLIFTPALYVISRWLAGLRDRRKSQKLSREPAERSANRARSPSAFRRSRRSQAALLVWHSIGWWGRRHVNTSGSAAGNKKVARFRKNRTNS